MLKTPSPDPLNSEDKLLEEVLHRLSTLAVMENYALLLLQTKQREKAEESE